LCFFVANFLAYLSELKNLSGSFFVVSVPLSFERLIIDLVNSE